MVREYEAFRAGLPGLLVKYGGKYVVVGVVRCRAFSTVLRRLIGMLSRGLVLIVGS